MGSSPSVPKEDPASTALRRRQAEQLLELDDQTNTRVKRMYSAAAGLQIARGTADSRLPYRNTTEGPAPTNYGLETSNAKGYVGKMSRSSAKRKQAGGRPRSGLGP